MDIIAEEQNQRALRGLRAGEIEYRAEPNHSSNFAPPIWLNQLFATAKRPGRVLADLCPAKFALPDGVSSVNLPILTTGTLVQPAIDATGVVDQDVVDTSGSSAVVTLASQADVALQALEQSPAGASLDWSLFKDMAEAADYDLESQLLYGQGSTYDQLTGVTNVSSITKVTFTNASPTGSLMVPYIAQAAAQLADARLAPPEVVLMRYARWAWLSGAEDTAGRPFLTPLAPWYFGTGPNTPDPAGSTPGLGLPCYTDEAIRRRWEARRIRTR